MKIKRSFMLAFAAGAALTAGSAQVSAYRCTPSTYAYCWEQRETCLVNGNDEDICNSEYFVCLALRGCG